MCVLELSLSVVPCPQTAGPSCPDCPLRPLDACATYLCDCTDELLPSTATLIASVLLAAGAAISLQKRFCTHSYCPRLPEQDGDTALHMAATSGHTACVELLLGHPHIRVDTASNVCVL
jgi:hypothetical protein